MYWNGRWEYESNATGLSCEICRGLECVDCDGISNFMDYEIYRILVVI